MYNLIRPIKKESKHCNYAFFFLNNGDVIISHCTLLDKINVRYIYTVKTSVNKVFEEKY